MTMFKCFHVFLGEVKLIEEVDTTGPCEPGVSHQGYERKVAKGIVYD